MVAIFSFIVSGAVQRMSKEKPLFFENFLKKSGFFIFLLCIGISFYPFIVFQSRIASVMLAQE